MASSDRKKYEIVEDLITPAKVAELRGKAKNELSNVSIDSFLPTFDSKPFAYLSLASNGPRSLELILAVIQIQQLRKESVLNSQEAFSLLLEKSQPQLLDIKTLRETSIDKLENEVKKENLIERLDKLLMTPQKVAELREKAKEELSGILSGLFPIFDSNPVAYLSLASNGPRSLEFILAAIQIQQLRKGSVLNSQDAFSILLEKSEPKALEIKTLKESSIDKLDDGLLKQTLLATPKFKDLTLVAPKDHYGLFSHKSKVATSTEPTITPPISPRSSR